MAPCLQPTSALNPLDGKYDALGDGWACQRSRAQPILIEVHGSTATLTFVGVSKPYQGSINQVTGEMTASLASQYGGTNEFHGVIDPQTKGIRGEVTLGAGRCTWIIRG